MPIRALPANFTAATAAQTRCAEPSTFCLESLRPVDWYEVYFARSRIVLLILAFVEAATAAASAALGATHHCYRTM